MVGVMRWKTAQRLTLLVYVAFILFYGEMTSAKEEEQTTCTALDGTCTASDSISERKVPRSANADGSPREAERACLDRHGMCVDFAARGECAKNPGWMIVNCPRSCDPHNNACVLRDARLRCSRERLNMSSDPIYRPGDMDSMFSSIVERFGDKYEITIHSTSPWVVTFEDFLTDAEVDALIGTQDSWERSTDTGSANEYGETGRILSSGRTSSNSWCRERCENVMD